METHDRLVKVIRVVATVVLFLAGAAYLARGAYFAVSSSADYQLRWTEQQYVHRGKNPSAVLPSGQTVAPRPNARRTIPQDADLGLSIGGYPPWAYFTGAIFAWPPDFTIARWYFGAINLLLLVLLIGWAARLGRGHPGAGWLFAAALFATSSICTTLGLGQYGVVVLAAVIGAWWLDGRDRWFLAGCVLGMAMIKVTLAGPFLLPFVFRQRWKTVLTALAYIGVGSLVIWQVVDATPVAMINQMMGNARYFVGDHNLVSLPVARGVSAEDAIRVTAAGTTVAAIALLYVWRSAPMLTLFAIAGMAARVWTYHNHYDNLVLVFLMMALGVHALQHRRSWAWVGFVAMGLSLWFPARATEVAAYREFQWAVWSAGLALLLILEWPARRSVQRLSGM